MPPPSYGCFDVTGQPGSALALLPVALAMLLLRLRRILTPSEKSDGRLPLPGLLHPEGRTARHHASCPANA